MGAERQIVRLGIPALLVASCAGAAAVSSHATEAPSVAFGSHVVLAVQIALLFFYAGLLLLVPLLRALFDGDLPIELSLRGARWKEELYGFGAGSMARQIETEARAARADAQIKKEIRRLKEVLREAEMTQDEMSERLLRRIVALEKDVGINEERR